MTIIKQSVNFDPYFNSAMEEYFLRNPVSHLPLIIFWQNQNAVILGSNQIVEAETNAEFIKSHNVKIARRLSGGGAVYHDLGNICFSFIAPHRQEATYRSWVSPIIDFFKSKNLNVNFSGRNDLELDGKKISGSAQYLFGNLVLHHGTLLFDLNVEMMLGSLNPDRRKIESHAVSSVRGRVGNIYDALKAQLHSSADLIEELVNYFKNNNPTCKIRILSETEIAEIDKIAKEKYAQNSWIFGRSPSYSFKTESRKFPGGLMQIWISLDKNKFTDIRFSGDFLSRKNVEELSSKIRGLDFDKDKVKKFLSNFSIEDYFGSISIEEITNLMFDK